jgi:hypothetical protein
MKRLRLHAPGIGNRLVRGVIVLAVIPAFLMQTAPAYAAPVLDQSFTAPDDLANIINEGCRLAAQTFTAGVTGTLAGVNIDVRSFYPTYPLRVAIRTARGGNPTSTFLGVALLKKDNNAPLSRLITFPTTVSVSAGRSYAIVVNYKGAVPGAGQGQGYWRGATGNVYTRGHLLGGECPSYGGTAYWHPFPTYDVHFRTFVDPSSV